MIYDIRHVTTYNYASPVSFARCALRLVPESDAGQQLLSHKIDIKPKPALRQVRTDFFGTIIECIVVDTPHRLLRIDSRARVAVERIAPPQDAQSPPWEYVRDLAFAATDIAARSPVNYVFPSPLIPVVREATAYAVASFPEGRGILAGSADLMQRIYREFKYDATATVISTPLREVFENRRGVCQDFAHVMIAGLRGLGLPAAYVSGYLRTMPLPGQPRLQGADATHAWAAVWCGDESGWIGFDPTNNVLVASNHVVLAIGRDFSDVSPVDGVIVGSRRQRLGVAVDVIPLDAANVAPP